MRSNPVAVLVTVFRSSQSAIVVALVLATALAVDAFAAPREDRAQEIPNIDARVVAENIPGASALAQVGTFLNVPPPGACANPIPNRFSSYIQPGAVLDSNRVLVGSTSNFGARRAIGAGSEGAFLSIDPSGAASLKVPRDFASDGAQASALGGAVQMFSANS